MSAVFAFPSARRPDVLRFTVRGDRGPGNRPGAVSISENAGDPVSTGVFLRFERAGAISPAFSDREGQDGTAPS